MRIRTEEGGRVSARKAYRILVEKNIIREVR